MMGDNIDFRSDTVTWPTEAMRLAMAQAPVGDDVYGDDPTVLLLEREAARMLGKEAALFVTSGTMGNQLAIMAQTRPTDEIILSERSHIVWHEAGAAALLSNVQLRCLPVENGLMDLAKIEATIRKTPQDIHSPTTRLICLEDADSDGNVPDLEYLKKIRALADRYHVAVHLDGARLFNAATALNVSAAAISREVDTVMCCLSKGLCAPVGSILAGPQVVIDLARRKRKMLGGGWRQAGMLAAAGLIALRDMSGRLADDHALAQKLAADITALGPNWFTLVSKPQINLVFLQLTGYPLNGDVMTTRLRERGILINAPDEGVLRLACHYWITPEDVTYLLTVLKEIAEI
ncbi:MAG: GntG family PLP-dependent aldolase [Eubacteriales bacterium]|nr:GntG family PLP-dependent aldolase [Eubacteriales bacterium]